MCSNCHREIHNTQHSIENITELIKNYKHPLYEKTIKKVCLRCGKPLLNDNTSGYCRECLVEKNRQDKHYPSKNELYQKYDELKSWEKVAVYFGITRRIIQRLRQKC